MIVYIFNKKISWKDLCSLAAVRHGSPDIVKDIISGGTFDQICQMVRLSEKQDAREPDIRPGSGSGMRNSSKRKRKRQRGIRTTQDDVMLDKINEVKTLLKMKTNDLQPLGCGFTVPTPI